MASNSSQLLRSTSPFHLGRMEWKIATTTIFIDSRYGTPYATLATPSSREQQQQQQQQMSDSNIN